MRVINIYMSILITYPSALEYWMKYDTNHPLNHADGPISNIPSDSASRDYLLKQVQKFGFKLPIHVLVPERSERSHGSKFVCHLAPKNTPHGSIIKLSNEIYIVSPEFCLLLAARELDIAELAILATDLMGIYRFEPSAKFSMTNREPLTSLDKISVFLNTAKSISGIKKANIAIHYAFERSNSPVESKLAVVASLPCMYGGYGIIRPELNRYISLSSDGKKLLNRETSCCDMVWFEKRFVVEYDSNLVHNSPGQVRYDKKRSDAVLMSGFSLLHVPSDYFCNQNTIDELFILIRKCLGMRSIKPKLDKYKEKRFELLKKLFLTWPSL